MNSLRLQNRRRVRLRRGLLLAVPFWLLLGVGALTAGPEDESEDGAAYRGRR